VPFQQRLPGTGRQQADDLPATTVAWLSSGRVCSPKAPALWGSVTSPLPQNQKCMNVQHPPASIVSGMDRLYGGDFQGGGAKTVIWLSVL